MPDTTVRGATLADDAGLAAIDARTWSTLHSVQPPREAGAAFFSPHGDPGRCLVAELDSRLAGYIRLVPPTDLVCNAHVRRIQGLAVDLWARGRGGARVLLDAAVAQARRQGALRITLRVLGHNAPARRLYESAGFAVEGVLPGEFLLDGAYVDDVLMGQPVGFDGRPWKAAGPNVS
jgi:RimJ/RimL family protein N-acetyltransferase